MAVTTTLYSGSPQYYDGNISGCVGGGSDYRTVGKGETINTYLFCPGDMTGLSSACRISKVSISFKSRYTLSTNTAGWGNYNVKANAMIYTSMPSISGTSANAGTGSHGSVFAAYSKNNVSSSSSYASYSFSGSPANAAGETIYGGSKGLVCAGFPLSHNGNLDCRIWLSECTFTVTRTRACYITFTGEGITTTKNMYDYNTVPSFGSAPTRDGYTFKGWKSSANGNVYQGALPTAYESDITFTAQWERTYPVFQSITMIYSGEPISKTNKVLIAQSFIISASVS